MSADAFDLDRNADPASSPTIKVEIYDQAYTVRSDGDPDYLKELAHYVDQRMREISSGTLTVDSRKVAILAALYIADELHQLRKLQEQSDEQLATRSVECSEMLDRLLKVPRSLSRPAAASQPTESEN
jgi:cell division protein ZapA